MSTATLSVDALLSAITAAGVLSSEELDTVQRSLPGGVWPGDAAKVLESLHRAGKLTKFQGQMLYAGRGTSLLLGEYVLVDKLGAGGMGQVFKARHRRMKREVALKVLPSAVQKDPALIARFQREVEAAAKLTHPNVVVAHDAGESRGVHYLVTEYVPGCDLAAFVKEKGPLPPAWAVELTYQAALGLDYAHRQGVIHRDIKPSNFLINHTGVVKVADLGLARVMEPAGSPAATPADGLTNTGAVMGTIDYMAPEQALDTHTADARSDIYSLGCTLHFLLTGQPPFPTGTVVQKILAHRELPPPVLSSHEIAAGGNEVSLVAINEVFQRMLAKAPADRYQSMADVLTALNSLRGNSATVDLTRAIVLERATPVPTTPGSPTKASVDALSPTVIPGGPTSGLPTIRVDDSDLPSGRKPVRRRTRLTWSAGVFLGLSLLIGVPWFARPPKPGAPVPETIPKSSVQKTLAATANPKPSTSRVAAPLLNPARIPAEERRGDQPLELVGVLGSSRLRHWHQVKSLAYTDDGQFLWSAGLDGFVKLWDGETLALRAVRKIEHYRYSSNDARGIPIESLAWDPRRNCTWLGVGDGTIRKLEFRESTIQETLQWPADRSIRHLALSPNGRWLAALSWPNKSVALWDLEASPPKLVVTKTLKNELGAEGAATVAFRPDGQRLYAGGNQEFRAWDVTELASDTRSADWSPREIEMPGDIVKDWQCGAICFNRHGTEMLVSDGYSLRMLEGVATDELVLKQDVIWGSVAALSPQEHWLATNTNSYDSTLLFDRARQDWAKHPWVLTRMPGTVVVTTSIAFRPDEQRLVAGDMYGRIREWDLTTTPPMERFPPPPGSLPIDLAFSPQGDQLFVGSRDLSATLWQWQDDRFLPRHQWTTEGGTRSGTWTADGNTLAFVLGARDQAPTIGIYVRPADSLQRISVPGEGGALVSTTISADGLKLAAGMADKLIHLWSRASPADSWRYQERLATSATTHSLAFLDRGQQLAAVVPYIGCSLFDFRHQPTRLRAELPVGVSLGNVSGQLVAVTSDGHWLLTGGHTFHSWDLSPDQPRRSQISGRGCDGLSLSPNGRLVCGSGSDGTVGIYDAEIMTQRHLYQMVGSVYDVDWHPSGEFLATANGDGTIYLLKVPESVRAE